MARNKEKFRKDLEVAFKKAELASFTATFDTNLDEDDTVAVASRKMAANCANAYSRSIAPDIASIIDEYLDSLMFDISKLTTSMGPVKGELKIKP